MNNPGYRPDGLQDDDFLGNEVVRLGLQPQAARLYRLLEGIELRGQPLDLSLAARKARSASSAESLATSEWFTGMRQDQ